MVATNTGRPRILYLTHHLPWPTYSGGRLREAEHLRRLAPRFDIEVIAVSKDPVLDRAHLREAELAGVRARIFSASLDASPALSPHIRRHQSAEARHHLAQRLAGHPPPIVHVEGHYLFPLVPEHAHDRTLIIEHNVESELFSQEARAGDDPRRAAALLADADLTRRTEQACWRAAAVIGAVTEDDAAHIRRTFPGITVPVIPGGADHILGALRRESVEGRIVFVANFGYPPNLDAARLIVEEILPGVWDYCPEATMTFTGPQPPDWLRAAAADRRVTVTGFVTEVTGHLDEACVVLVPLRIGGGIKIKVVEALARGRALVTTPVGLQGLRHLPDGAAVECPDVPALIAACVRLLRDPAERERQESRALKAATYLPTWGASADLLAATWDALAATASHAARVGS
ncbi:glycosyltransferase [Sphaerisporangium sp. NPDC051011]|uniref:glycosyltransferase n=1 Tax=Sphaerisporangium sp. NPDC051011 TaxID=3155792 RepID=UPI0033C29D86